MPIDYSNYPPNWLIVIRPRILARARHQCEFCGVANYAIIERQTKRGRKRKVRIVLTVAHLDHNAHDWSVPDERLAALCQRCHLNYDRRYLSGRRVTSRRYGRNYRERQLHFSLN